MVQREMLQDRSGSCPFCGSREERVPVATLQSDPLVRMLECRICAVAGAEAFPTEPYLEKLYDPSNYSGSVDSDLAVARKCANAVAAYLGSVSSERLRILDYGGGTGNLARELAERVRARGFNGEIEATVVDLFPGGHRDVIYVSPREFWASESTFDVVLASAVLEHLPNMSEVLNGLWGRVDRGGVFYARTPYEVPLARSFGGYSLRWPRHLFDMGQEFWDLWMEAAGVSRSGRISRPSIVETSFRRSPVRTVVATVFKWISRIELITLKKWFSYHGLLWRWVGGWEVLCRR